MSKSYVWNPCTCATTLLRMYDMNAVFVPIVVHFSTFTGRQWGCWGSVCSLKLFSDLPFRIWFLQKAHYRWWLGIMTAWSSSSPWSEGRCNLAFRHRLPKASLVLSWEEHLVIKRMQYELVSLVLIPHNKILIIFNLENIVFIHGYRFSLSNVFRKN